MSFLTEHCLFQTLILSAIMQQDEASTFSRLAPLYALSNNDYARLRELLSDDTFQKLNSSSSVILHENFLQTFCPDKNEFGNKSEEWHALEIKRKVYTIFENLGSEMHDIHETLSAATNKSDKLSVTLALLYYLSKAKSEMFLPFLRRAEGHGNAEATVLLMALEKERKATLFEKLCNSKELLLVQDDTLQKLADYYGLGNMFEDMKGVKKDD